MASFFVTEPRYDAFNILLSEIRYTSTFGNNFVASGSIKFNKILCELRRCSNSSVHSLCSFTRS